MWVWVWVVHCHRKWIDFHRQSNRQLRFTWINTEIKMYYFIRCVNSKMYEFFSPSARYTFVIWHRKFFFAFLQKVRCTKWNMAVYFATIESKKNSIYYAARRVKHPHGGIISMCEWGICRKVPMILPNFDLYTYMPFASFSTLILP